MAQITWGTIEPLDVPNFNVSVIANIFPTAQDPELIAGDYRLLGEPDVVTQFLGTGFTFANGFPVGGVVSSLVTTDGGRLVGRFDGLAIPAADLAQWIFAGDDATARAALFASTTPSWPPRSTMSSRASLATTSSMAAQGPTRWSCWAAPPTTSW